MKYFYSLYTGELVQSDVRADWMGETEVEPPETDVDQSAFFEDGIWVIRGAEPEPELVPSVVTRRQGRLALLNVGKLDDVEAAIDAIEDPAQKRAAQIEYEADTWERSNPFLQALWSQLGGTEQELDDLFRLGATF